MLVTISDNSPVSTPYVDANGNQYPPNMETVWSADQLAAIGLKSVASPVTVAGQVQSAIAAGLAVTSASTPALDGTYAVDTSAQTNIQAVVTGIAAGLGLPGGGTTFAYFDANGGEHVFTAAQFEALAVAIRNYVYALDLYEAGQGALPPSTAVLA